MYSEWSKKLVSNTYNIVTLDNDIQQFKTKIEELEELNKTLNELLKGYDNNLKTMEDRRDSILQLRNNDIDEELFKINPDSIQKEIDRLINDQKSLKNAIDSINVTEPSEYYHEDEHDMLKKKISDLSIRIRVSEMDIKGKEDFIVKMENSSVCPLCKQSLKDVDHTKEIEDAKCVIEKLKEEKNALESEQVKLKENELRFTILKKEYDLYEREKLVNQSMS